MDNLYYYEWKRLVEDEEDLFNFSAYVNRKNLVRKYAWAVPDERALDIITKLNQPIVEMGAGTGYWARLLRDKGVNIITYDTAPPRRSGNQWGHDKQYTNVRRGGPNILVNHSERALFLCWPPYDADMAENCLRQWKGSYLIYVGEGYGGCTANDSFFKIIEDEFDILTQYQIPQWPGVHDELIILKRKSS